MNAVAVGESSPPFSEVVFDVILSFGVAGRDVEPVEMAVVVFFVVEELSDVQIAVAVNFYPLAFFFIIGKSTFINMTIGRDLYAPAVSLFAIDFSKVDFSLTFDEFEFGAV